MSQPVVLTQFAEQVQKNRVTVSKLREFRSWMEKKCPEEHRSEARRLLAQAEQLLSAGPAHPARPASRPAARPQGPRAARPGGSGGGPTRGDHEGAAPAAKIGSPFHNPYTFLPFASEPPERRPPTPLTIDEIEPNRFTGILELEVETLSPLLTCESKPIEVQGGHATYRALAIGPDVVVPATGVRGALRTLLTVLTGGTLGYVDEWAWLVQGRDPPLGPGPKGAPPKPVLAEVVEVGDPFRRGRVRVGETRLVPADLLAQVVNRDLGRGLEELRPGEGRRQAELWTDERVSRIATQPEAGLAWKVKLSGSPVNKRGRKKEGLFRAAELLELPEHLWATYAGRYRHGHFPQLQKGDLVWLELRDPAADRPRKAEEVVSIQWARWGRRGEGLLDVVRARHPNVLPDSFCDDGLVDEVTDLFGQVPVKPGAAGPFAARVRPENLVFFDAKAKVLRETLAPLAPPHPGCAAFYRAETDPDRVKNADSGLRGYKVYRTAKAPDQPWRYEVQGVYERPERLRTPRQRVNKTVELVPAGTRGRLRIACRALSEREVALLLAACGVDWRLGGGKPLGLGLCRVRRARLLDETGAQRAELVRGSAAIAEVPKPWADRIEAKLRERMVLWQRSQEPVERLRYPRAVSERARGGHVWFGRHASPRKQGAGGLQVIWADGRLRETLGAEKIAAQPLPEFDPTQPTADQLFGYDLVADEEERNGCKRVRGLEPFREGGGWRPGRERT